MGLTQNERLLVGKLPEQWRGLLTLLFNKSLRRDKLMSVAAMYYKRRAAQSAESWDELLTALSKTEPAIDAGGNICFQSALWGFPDPVIDGFLKLLIRFQDTVSADSLDRFLTTMLAKNRSLLVQSVWEELTMILARRNGSGPEDQTQQESGWRKSVHARRTGILLDGVGAIDGGQAGSGSHKSTGVSAHGTEFPHADIEGLGSEPPDMNASSPASNFGHSCKSEANQFQPGEHSETKPAKDKEGELEDADSDVIVLDDDDNHDNHDDDDDDNHDDDDTHHPRHKEPGKAGQRPEPFSGSQADGTVTREMTEGSQAVHNQVNQTAATTCCPDGGPEQHHGSEIDAEYRVPVQKLREALLSGDEDLPLDLDFLSTLPASQMSTACDMTGLSQLTEGSLSSLIQHLATISQQLSYVSSEALISSIVKQKYLELQETPSRQMMSCLCDLAASFPRQLASVLCDCLQQKPCSAVQAEVVSSLCRSWDSSTLVHFVRGLCSLDIQLDENLLTVVQCVIGGHPDLTPDLVDSAVHLLETGAALLAKNAKYGRLILNFVKAYRNQMNSSHSPALQSIASVHTSVIRKSLRSAVDALPS